MGIFRKSPQELAKSLQKLRKTRIKEEGHAKLRTLEEKERTRITKARATAKPKSFFSVLASPQTTSKTKKTRVTPTTAPKGASGQMPSLVSAPRQESPFVGMRSYEELTKKKRF